MEQAIEDDLFPFLSSSVVAAHEFHHEVSYHSAVIIENINFLCFLSFPYTCQYVHIMHIHEVVLK